MTRLIDELKKLPGIGSKSAQRLAFHILRSSDADAVITGDLMHHPVQMAEPDWCSGFDSDLPQARATRRAFCQRYADGPVRVLGTHFHHPTAGRIVRHGATWRFLA